MTAVGRVLVVGAGIGGLAAATALRQRGIDADVIERKTDSTVYGVGINQPANALRALRALGVLDEVLDAGFAFDRYSFHDYKDTPIVDVPSQIGGDDVPANVALTRRDLHRILLGASERAGAEIRYGTTVDRVEDDGEQVRVTSSDGREGTYDLVVGVDGIFSALRQRHFGREYAPWYTGYGVWRVTKPRPAATRSGVVYQGINAKGGVIPLNERELYLFLVTPEPEGVRHPADQLPELLRERLVGFEGLPGQIRDGLTATDDVVYSPLNEVLLPAPWHRRRVVIMGDAAHACAPHLTQGAGMALEDAVVLAEELDADRELETALTAFGERRHPRVKLVHDVSRAILDAEMEVTSEEALERTASYWRASLAAQTADVDAFLKQPA